MMLHTVYSLMTIVKTEGDDYFIIVFEISASINDPIKLDTIHT